ncbi:SSI family serine proteinase inhibitor [Streptomyces sp. NPDC001781]
MAACLLAPGTTALAASGDRLALTVTRPGTTSGGGRAALLLCDPPKGHPKAAEACAELTSAEGDFSRPRDSGTLCALVCAPVRARAQGRRHGRRCRAGPDGSATPARCAAKRVTCSPRRADGRAGWPRLPRPPGPPPTLRPRRPLRPPAPAAPPAGRRTGPPRAPRR